MKLAFCLFKYFPYGGLQRDFIRIARACMDRGHTVEAFCLAWQGPEPYWLPVKVLSRLRFTNHGRCRAFYRSLKRTLAKGNHDLVVGFDKMPGLDLYYAADPCFVARAGETHSRLYRLTRRYRHFSAFEAAVFDPAGDTEILAISEEEQKNYEYYYDISPERFHYLPPGISKSFVPPEGVKKERASLRRELFGDIDQVAALFVGSDFKRKGLDRVIHAMAALTPSERQALTVHVLGQDTARPYERMAKKVGVKDHIRFWGGQDDVRRFFWAADFLIHPAYSENTGTVLLEAVVAGLPVITTDVCGYAQHIRDSQAGMVVSLPFNTRALTASLEHMVIAKKRTIFAGNARKYAATHDLHSLPEKAAEIVERCALAKKNSEGSA